MLHYDPGMNAVDWTNRRALTDAGFVEKQAESPAGRQTWFAAGDGPPLFLLHGAGDNAGTWSKAAGPLLARGRYRIVIPDLAGHGASEPAEGPLSMETFLAGFEAVACQVSVEPAILVGNSFGAWLAMSWTERYPARVQRVIAVDGAALKGSHGLSLTPETVEDACRLWQAVVDSSKWSYGPLVAGELVRKGREGALSRYHPETMLPYLMDGRLHEFPRPVDLIWGESDGLLPLDYARRAEAGLRAVRLTIIPRCGHVPQQECPEEFNAVLAAVLDQPPPGERAP